MTQSTGNYHLIPTCKFGVGNHIIYPLISLTANPIRGACGVTFQDYGPIITQNTQCDI